MAVERGKFGILAKEIFVAFANSSANAPKPEPSTNAILGRSLVLDRMNFAAFSAWRNSAEGFVLVFFAGIIVVSLCESRKRETPRRFAPRNDERVTFNWLRQEADDCC